MQTGKMMAALIAAGALAAPGLAAAADVSTVADGVSLQQFQQAARDRMFKADSDGDGKLSAAEWSVAAAARGAKRDPARLFAILDRNRDSFLDGTEIDSLTARRFARLDADGDGKASAAERKAARGAMAD